MGNQESNCWGGHDPVALAVTPCGGKMKTERLKQLIIAHIWKAAENGDAIAIENLLIEARDTGTPIDFMFYPGLTPARAAANRGHAAVLHALICGGIPVDVPAHDGTTPVFGAVQSPPHLALPTVSLLLEGGAVDSNHCAQHGDTPIFHAARCGRPDIILKLYEHGALIDCSTHHGTTPLMTAAERGDIDSIKILLACGADVHRPASNGTTALYAAAERGHLRAVLAMLAAGANVDAQRRGGQTALFTAVVNGWVRVARALLDKGADVNLARQMDGCTPLHAVFDTFEWVASAAPGNAVGHGNGSLFFPTDSGSTGDANRNSSNFNGGVSGEGSSLPSSAVSTSAEANCSATNMNFNWGETNICNGNFNWGESSLTAAVFAPGPSLTAPKYMSPTRRLSAAPLPVVHEEEFTEEDETEDEGRDECGESDEGTEGTEERERNHACKHPAGKENGSSSSSVGSPSTFDWTNTGAYNISPDGFQQRNAPLSYQMQHDKHKKRRSRRQRKGDKVNRRSEKASDSSFKIIKAGVSNGCKSSNYSDTTIANNDGNSNTNNSVSGVRRSSPPPGSGAEQAALHMMQLLIKHGADLSKALVPSKETVLHVAVKNGLMSAVRLLAPISPDPAAAAEEGNTVAHFAAKYGRVEILGLLLQLFGDVLVNASNESGETPLHLAARHNQGMAIKTLVAAGAVIDARRDFDQGTALCVACLFNSVEAAELLLRHGAALTPRGILTPRNQALAWGNHALAKYLEDVERAGPDGYRSWVREPRIALLKLRLLVTSNRASLVPPPKNYGAKDRVAQQQNDAITRHDIRAERAIQYILGTGPSQKVFASDIVFTSIVSFWWP